MSDQPQANTPQRSGGTFWIVLWMSVLTVGLVAGAGAYLDYRLNQFENRLDEEVQYTQSEIYKNRQETADFAKQVSGTLKDLSDLLTTTVDSVSRHTKTLAQAIEKKEQSQVEAINASLEKLSQEIRAQNEELRATLANLGDEVQSVQGQIASVEAQTQKQTKAMTAMQEKVDGQFASLTDLAKSLENTMQTRFAAQSKTLNDSIAKLESHSDKKLQELAGELDKVSQGVATVHNTQNAWQERVLSKKGESASVMAGIHEQLRSINDQVEVGFAGNHEQTKVLRSDLAELSHTLTQRTEDLLVRMIDAKEDQSEQAAQQSEEIGARLNDMKSSLSTELENSVAAAQNAAVQGVGQSVDQLMKDLAAFGGTLGEIHSLMQASLKNESAMLDNHENVNQLMQQVSETLTTTHEQLDQLQALADSSEAPSDESQEIGMTPEPDKNTDASSKAN